jgi:hypothetical protein
VTEKTTPPSRPNALDAADGALVLWRMGAIDEVGLTLGETEKLLIDTAHTDTGRTIHRWQTSDWAHAVEMKLMTHTARSLFGAAERSGLRSQLAPIAARGQLMGFAYPAGRDARRDWLLLAIRFRELSKLDDDVPKLLVIAGADADNDEFRTAMLAAAALVGNNKTTLDEAVVTTRVPEAGTFAARLRRSGRETWTTIFERIVASERRAVPSIAAFDSDAQTWTGSTNGLPLADVIGWYHTLARRPEALESDAAIRDALDALPRDGAAAWKSVLFETSSVPDRIPAFDTAILRQAFALGSDLRPIAAMLAEIDTADGTQFRSPP